MAVLSEEQTMLRDAAKSWVSEKSPVTAFRKLRDSGNADGFDRTAWSEMAQMGWAGILIPEEFGGSGLGYLTLGLVLEETGRTLTASPLVSTALTAATALLLGGNDAQKTMGIIAVLLFSQGYLGGTFHVPFWVVISCQTAMALGTLFGGWRIVHTMGSKITKLNPMQGFCAETGGALTLFGAAWLGIPVSTTHTITGAIVGVGAAKRVSAVRWGLASNIVIAWIVTLPSAALISAAFYAVSSLF